MMADRGDDDTTARAASPLTVPGLDTSRRDVLRGALAGGAIMASGGLAAACGGSAPKPSTKPSSHGTRPRQGGNLRVGILGGSTSDTLDAHKEVVQPDAIRIMALYNSLVRLDAKAQVVNDLAEELTPNKDASTWTIRLKQGVTFHNGKDLTADDVIFTFRRIANPKAPLDGATGLAPLDLASLKALDPLTVRVPMKTPYASFPEQMSAAYNFGIVPIGYDPAHPVGTGPFKYHSFVPGRQSVFVRNPHYFKTGLPYLDQLTIIDYSSDTAAFNALQGGQLDVYSQATLTLVNQIKGSNTLKALVSLPGQWTPFTMRVDTPPFNDVRVRQAFRLLVDRPQLISLALDGFGSVGNDLFSQWDPCYASNLHRQQDIGQAKSLLKKAGHENLAVQLVTADFATGVVQGAQVFAQQAKAAGVTVTVKQVPVGTFYGPNYLRWPFAQDFWAVSPYLSQVAQGSLSNSPFNETHWNDPVYVALYNRANATTDAASRCNIIRQMQMIDFEKGGYIIASYNKQVDLMSTRVNGFVPGGTGVPLGNAGWESAWIA
jgi:peptide/nickel transport system substrate-binding protein